MATAGDVGRRQQADEPFVMTAAGRALELAHVRGELDGSWHGHLDQRPRSWLSIWAWVTGRLTTCGLAWPMATGEE